MRSVLLIDAEYVFDAASEVKFGERRGRDAVSLALPVLIEQLRASAGNLSDAPYLRAYWYDPADANSAELQALALHPRVKVRPGEASVLFADMSVLAQRHGVSDMILVTGDADLVPAVIEAQAYGVAVHLIALVSGHELDKARAARLAPALHAEVDTVQFVEMAGLIDVAGAGDAQGGNGSGRVTSITKSTSPAPSVPDMDWARRIVHTILEPMDDEMIAEVLAKNPRGSLPREIDGQLLKVAKRHSGNELDIDAKRLLRRVFHDEGHAKLSGGPDRALRG